jgi:hypothetical protein
MVSVISDRLTIWPAETKRGLRVFRGAKAGRCGSGPRASSWGLDGDGNTNEEAFEATSLSDRLGGPVLNLEISEMITGGNLTAANSILVLPRNCQSPLKAPA